MIAVNNLPVFIRVKNSQKAWEFLNENMFNHAEYLIDKFPLTVRNGSELELHYPTIFIKRLWVNPNIDFGNYFGYRPQKWNSLVSNYIDKDELLEVIKEVQTREQSNSKNYNVSFQFSNKHGHGKGCLLSLTFSRVPKQSTGKPILHLKIRSSEITKRLLMDLLLVQRVAEKAYGRVKPHLVVNVSKLYVNGEAWTMYNNHKPLKEYDKHYTHEYCLKLRNLLRKFTTIDIDEVKYKVHKRCVRQLQRDKNGHPLSGNKPMLAKELQLNF